MAMSVVLLSQGGCIFLPRPSTEVQRAAEIESFYRKWGGSSYSFGGTSQSGIDCSALMVKAYSEIYNIGLPRTTENQAKMGKRVRKKNLEAGDLVFFKTGIVRKHVGIYVGDGVFVHSSASSGVIKSSLDTGYWDDHYWKAKRLLN
jgi:probable lipoprotein NlpC